MFNLSQINTWDLDLAQICDLQEDVKGALFSKIKLFSLNNSKAIRKTHKTPLQMDDWK